MQVDDIALMQRIAGRDQQAFMELYEKYGKAVFSLAYRIVNNSVLAEEIAQDTFLKVWHQPNRWDSDKGRLKSWLLTIAQFTAIDRLRQERRQPAVLPDALEDNAETVHLPDTFAWQEGSALKQLVAQLPRDQSALIELAFFQGMTHTEIADQLKLPLGTVKTRLRGGLRRLRDLWVKGEN
ncbi:MAG: sigma-70 family RNA polymerase sigma factor [Anaerolinea sp.]|nr:sigma-70 family RNA polymerase sigma factor [Anaerolinea sp.]